MGLPVFGFVRATGAGTANVPAGRIGTQITIA